MDPWEILGLRPDCEPEVFDAAVRALRLKYHPDKAGGSASRFRKIQEAARCCRTGEALRRDPLEDERLRERLRAFRDMWSRKGNVKMGPDSTAQ